MVAVTQRLCIVPRWSGTQSSEWYPWLRAQPSVRTAFGEVLGPEIDNPDTPTIDAWVASITAACGSDAAMLERTCFIGHSVGCQAVMRYLASLPAGVRVAGCLLVAAWWTLDRPWDTIRPWMYPVDSPQAPPLDLAHVRAACSRIVVLISDDDPFTADWQRTRVAWQERVGADVRVIPGARHFNSSASPAVLAALADLAG